jgi:hypothetical protein
MKRRSSMKLKHNIGQQAIQDVLNNHPHIGKILQEFDIGCVGCGVGICQLQDVVSIHALGSELEEQIETRINGYLDAAAHQENKYTTIKI